MNSPESVPQTLEHPIRLERGKTAFVGPTRRVDSVRRLFGVQQGALWSHDQPIHDLEHVYRDVIQQSDN